MHLYIQLIDQVNGEEQLREKEGQWAYRLKTLVPNGLNDNDFFFLRKTGVLDVRELLFMYLARKCRRVNG